MKRNSGDQFKTNSGGGDANIRRLERAARSSGAADDVMAWGRALRRAGGVPAEEADLLDAMGYGAWRAWLLDGEFEWRPDSVDSGESYPDPVEGDGNGDGGGSVDDAFTCQDPRGPDCHDDACPIHYGDVGPRTWRRGWSVRGIAVRRRYDSSPKIVATRWTVDDAGNWDAGSEDDWPIGSYEAELLLARSRLETLSAWDDYFEWVAERGRDPLHELPIPARRGPDETWRFDLEQKVVPRRGTIVLLRRAWRRPGGRKWTEVALIDVRAHVRSLLAIESSAILTVREGGKRFRALAADASLDEFRQAGEITKDKGDSLTLTLMVPGQPITPSATEIMDAADAQRERLAKDIARVNREIARLTELTMATIEADAGDIVMSIPRRLNMGFPFEVGMTLRKGEPGFAAAARVVSGREDSDYLEIRVVGGRTPEWLIYDSGSRQFWNNDMGWVGREAAQRFASTDYNLPPGGEWVTMEQARSLPHDDECSCSECVHDAVFCEACQGPPTQLAFEHEPNCALYERIACGEHHNCAPACRSCGEALDEDLDQQEGSWEGECRACRVGPDD